MLFFLSNWKKIGYAVMSLSALFSQACMEGNRKCVWLSWPLLTIILIYPFLDSPSFHHFNGMLEAVKHHDFSTIYEASMFVDRSPRHTSRGLSDISIAAVLHALDRAIPSVSMHPSLYSDSHSPPPHQTFVLISSSPLLQVKG